MDIIDLTCPECSGKYYGDTALLSLRVKLHCPFCGSYFKWEGDKRTVGADGKTSAIVGLSGDMDFYRPRERTNREEG